MQVFDPERWGPTKEDPQCYSKGILVYALNFVSEQLLTWKLLLSKLHDNACCVCCFVRFL